MPRIPPVRWTGRRNAGAGWAVLAGIACPIGAVRGEGLPGKGDGSLPPMDALGSVRAVGQEAAHVEDADKFALYLKESRALELAEQAADGFRREA